MRIALFYPPDRTIPSMAYSSLSVLATAMRARGHEVMVMDINLEVTDFLIQKDRLLAFRDFVEQEFSKLESMERIPAQDRWRYELFSMLMATPRESIEAAEQGKAIMRDPARFFEPALFNQAFNDLSAAFRMIFAATPLYYPENPTYIKDCLAFLATGPGDPVMEVYRNELRDKVLEWGPHIIGQTLPFHQQFIEALKFSKAIKEVKPEIKSVIGGTSVVDYSQVYFADNALEGIIDFGIMNDGECALDSLTQAVEGKRAYTDVPNLIWSDQGKIVRNPLEEKLQDLNDAPTTDFDGIPLSRYLMPYAVANMCTSRGCYYGKCAFCGDSFRRNFRMRKPELVFEDIKTIRARHDIRFFFFWDSLAPPRTLRYLAEGIKRENLDIRWFAETRLEKTYTNLDLLKLMFEGGCRVLQFGFESGNQRVLDLMRKGNKMDVVEEIFKNMKTAGLNACTSWFIGFPTETRSEAMDSYRFIHEHRDVICLSVYTGTFMIGGDTDVVLNPDRYGIKVALNDRGGYDWEHTGDFEPWDLKPWNEAFTARSDIVLLNHGHYVLYHAERPGTVLETTGFGRVGRLAFEIPDIAAAVPFIPPGNRIRSYCFDPAPGKDDLVPGEKSFLLAYVARSGWIFPVDELTQKIFERVDGQTSLGRIAEETGEPKEEALKTAGIMIDRGMIAGWIDLPEGYKSPRP